MFLPRFWCHYYEDELPTRPSTRYGTLVAPPGERFIYSNLLPFYARLERAGPAE